MNNRHRQIVKAVRMQLRTRYPLTALMTGIDWDALGKAMQRACETIIAWMDRVGKVVACLKDELNKEAHHD